MGYSVPKILKVMSLLAGKMIGHLQDERVDVLITNRPEYAVKRRAALTGRSGTKVTS